MCHNEFFIVSSIFVFNFEKHALVDRIDKMQKNHDLVHNRLTNIENQDVSHQDSLKSTIDDLLDTKLKNLNDTVHTVHQKSLNELNSKLTSKAEVEDFETWKAQFDGQVYNYYYY
jgi:hypothetical protein